MTAIPNLRATNAQPLPAFSAVVQTIPYAPQKIALQGELFISATDTGLIAYSGSNPVCWVMAGYHLGQQDKQPKQCDFIDIAFFRQTQRGQNLETLEVDTLPEALQFISDTFGGATND